MGESCDNRDIRGTMRPSSHVPGVIVGLSLVVALSAAESPKTTSAPQDSLLVIRSVPHVQQEAGLLR